MGMKMLAGVATVVALGAPVAARAATPFDAGTGNQFATVAVAADGTGHVAWTKDDTTPYTIGYCRVPAGGSACDVTKALQIPGKSNGTGVGDANVFAVAPGTIEIFVTCDECVVASGDPTYFQQRVLRWTSTDDGATFGTPVDIGLTYHHLTGQGVARPSDGIFAPFLDDIQALPGLDQHVIPWTTIATTNTQDQEIAAVPGGGYVAVASGDPSANIHFGTYTGPASPSNDQLGTQANWAVDAIANGGDEYAYRPSLATGSQRLVLLYNGSDGSGAGMRARRFDPALNSFGPYVSLPAQDTIDKGPWSYDDVTGDGSGGVHAVYTTLYDNGRLRYSHSTDDGATWSAPATVAKGEPFVGPQIAVGATGSGFAVWGLTGGTRIRVVALDPQAETLPTSSSGGGGGGGGTGGGTGGSAGTGGDTTTTTAPPPPPARPLVSGVAGSLGAIRRTGSTTLRFTLSSPASAVDLTFALISTGRRSGERCVKQSRANRRKAACPLYVTKAKVTVTGQAGPNSVRVSAHEGGRTLAPGTYRIEVQPFDENDDATNAADTKLKIKR